MFQRSIVARLSNRLGEAVQRIQIITGPRQVGKTTAVQQAMAPRHPDSWLYAATDEPAREVAAGETDRVVAYAPSPAGVRIGPAWLDDVWNRAASRARVWSSTKPTTHAYPFVLVLDEIQKAPRWSEAIKGLWDRGRAERLEMHLVLLGSSPLLMQSGMTESLAGRFEVLRMSHWTFVEMNDAFGYTLEEFLHFGSVPGSALLVRNDEPRWREYVLDSMIAPNVERDVLAMERIDKPALLQQLLRVGCSYSGQIVALSKVLGQLQDAGNVTTLARYLELLGNAGLLAGLRKHARVELRRQSAPKFQVLNNAFMAALGSHAYAEARADRTHWGRVVESAVGSYLCALSGPETEVGYWRNAPHEVDFVVRHRGVTYAIEVKSGREPHRMDGMDAFLRTDPDARRVLVGTDALPLGEFLRTMPDEWVRG